LPYKVSGVEQVKFAVRQAFVEVLGVDRRDDRVSEAGDDLHGRLDLGQDITECFELDGIRLHVAHRFCESIAFERGQVILASRIAEDVALERLDHAIDDRASPESSIWLEIRRKHPFAQRVSELYGNRGTAGAHDQAQKTTGVCSCREKRGRGADIPYDDLWFLEPKRIGHENDECAHRPR